MTHSQLNKSRFVVGVVLVIVAALMFIFLKGDYSTAGAIAIGILGLVWSEWHVHQLPKEILT